ncbi:MAG: molybdopterin-dependent oxidoreductase [Bacteroidales bacterium]|jgi:formate dehydrogenase major subunit|nr:molybdopterin-dependent oxidoreductase [Bacteroidales bacterium]
MQENTPINITIDGEQIVASKHETILDVANRMGKKIPTLCHDPRLKPFSSCFVCVVEVEGTNNLQPSCSTKVTDGMVIQTNNDKVRASRKTALDLLQSNHYADCTAPCKQTCPAGVDVQGYISLMEKGLYKEAVALIKEVNPLPAICGRVCVRPCEVACRRNLMDEGAPVGIDYLKRYASDVDLDSNNSYKPEVKPSTGKRVAVIGAGPGGLSAAYFLQQEGHQVDIFESKPYGGGWLRYGIPEYRLPNNLLDKEIEKITELGTNIFFNKTLGDNLSYKDIKANYHSTILTIGSQRGTLLGTTGEDAENVYSGVDFLRNMEVTGKPADFTGKTVVVVGGGNTAMDCCRTAQRCGAEKTYVVYRRTEAEMPANPIEIHESKIEGVEYLFLTNPVEVNKDDNGKLKSLTLIKMELGEPDASGRRRPVPVDGSEYELQADYVLAAIGQKTDINFLNDINSNTDHGELKANRWGDIDADSKTLETDIKGVFAAGDGVTGPATIIEAIAQAGIAAHSCNQFLNNQKITPKTKEFLSKKENFKNNLKTDVIGRYARRNRYEMPVLPANDRINFKEVELGYTDENRVKDETHRCLECGCTEVFDCNLKDYSTEYGADQNRFKGDFVEKPIDFSHSFIEINNNKCILCSRCVRICSEVVGADALGLIERGFTTYVAPSMGKSLNDTNCESCGMCISTCPTGAITENVTFKPGPVKPEISKSICMFCSVGCSIELHHNGGFVTKSKGAKGLINSDTNLCKYGKFGYRLINSGSRITKPLIKENGTYKPISFEKAFELIADRIKNTTPDSMAFFAGAGLTNEDMYLIQKLARAGANTNNIASFSYIDKNSAYKSNYRLNTPFEQLPHTSNIYVLGIDLTEESGTVGFLVNRARNNGSIISALNRDISEKFARKTDEFIKIESYYHFIKAANHYLLSSNKQNSLFIDDRTTGFNKYKEKLLKEDFNHISALSGVDTDTIQRFAEEYNKSQHAVIIFAENSTDSATSAEIQNLAIITGKAGKRASGLIALKPLCNSQGVFDMGIDQRYGVAQRDITDRTFTDIMKSVWKLSTFPEYSDTKTIAEKLDENTIKTMFIFGEDPIGCSNDKDRTDKWFNNSDFVLVQDFFMSETAFKADLILPATFPYETGGSYTNSQKIVQQFDKSITSGTDVPSWRQISEITALLGGDKILSVDDIRLEMFSFLVTNEPDKIAFTSETYTDDDCLFSYGCSTLNREMSSYFKNRLKH